LIFGIALCIFYLNGQNTHNKPTMKAFMNFGIELEQETDGRRIAEIPETPGAPVTEQRCGKQQKTQMPWHYNAYMETNNHLQTKGY